MKKDAYYFSHDSNAKDDPKCMLLIDNLGLEGYGIYWVLIEILRDQSDYRLNISMLKSIARKYATTFDKVKDVVDNYNLFTIDGDYFFSKSLIVRMNHLEKKREQRKIAGQNSAKKRLNFNENPTTVERPFNEISTTVQRPFNENPTTVERDFNDRSTSKVKESKVKESKVKESKVKEIELNYTSKIEKDKSIEDCCNDVLSDIISSESLQMRYKLTRDELNEKIRDFALKLKCEGVITKQPSEFKKYFSNWLNKQIYQKNGTTYKNQSITTSEEMWSGVKDLVARKMAIANSTDVRNE